jgi:hypothetical protein
LGGSRVTDPDQSGGSMRNPDLPIPRANTCSAVRNVVADAFTKLVQIERRFDPFVRPLFDATLRDPLARVVTALINRGRARLNR